MSHLLHVISSPRGQRSASHEVANAFIEAWQAGEAGATLDTLDVWQTPLPEFDGVALGAKYAALEGRERTAEEKQAWDEIGALAARFQKADMIVFSVPMWNFGIPYRLKHLIDVVSQKDLLFSFDERGLQGLLTHTRAVTIAARGAPLGAAIEHQNAYIRSWCEMVGIREHDDVIIEKTLFGPQVDAQARRTARDEAVALAGKMRAGG
ncbi:NAD(P)H-dependent oxidoreductase [Robbsia sp. Bb-Pol-6]|uniref:FMN dependent NADH:quinone oxidoreductase n=1 Tax=Robbsia betulipollinis TaxID=2981849 RepID=A0ABT3ZIA3_9BURK|nr:NAD(P)H-dependent oxidoreductase [Robbsia betulipollinis]MCY0386152.1 NAD(P)H-dependent oxidoreductase [Robbsia betulipollinis]